MDSTIQLSVLLLVRNRESMESDAEGMNREPVGDPDDYESLLSAFNMPYDILPSNRVARDTFVSENHLKYVAAVIALPTASLSDETLCILEEASRLHGVSLLASCYDGDERIKALFGIEKINRKRRLWPPRAHMVASPDGGSDFGKGGGVACLGFRSGFFGARRGGYGKMDFRKSISKLLRLTRRITAPYRAVKVRPEATILARTGRGLPLAWSYPLGKGKNYSIAGPPEVFMGGFGPAQKLLRRMIEVNSGFGLVSADLENTMAVRVDDPGACCSAYLDTGGVLDDEGWRSLGLEMKEVGVPISVAYTPLWVDDGKIESGRLMVGGREVTQRIPGGAYESALVCYLPKSEKAVSCDHGSEFRGIHKLSSAGIIDVQSHGLTHLDPDRKAWLSSGAGRRDPRWYHEYFHVPSGVDVAPETQLESLRTSREMIRERFGTAPVVLVPSGNRQGQATDLLAQEAGYLLFSSDYTGILGARRIVRNRKIPSLFLAYKGPFDPEGKGGGPFVGIVHDYEIKRHGPRWLKNLLMQWRTQGIGRVLSLRELAIQLTSSINAEIHPSGTSLRMRVDLPDALRAEKGGGTFQPVTMGFRFRLPEGVAVHGEPMIDSRPGKVTTRENERGVVRIVVRLDTPYGATVVVPLCPLTADHRVAAGVGIS